MADHPQTLAEMGEQRRTMRGNLTQLNKQIRERVLSEYDDGHGKTESQLSREAHVDRMTIRKWLGK